MSSDLPHSQSVKHQGDHALEDVLRAEVQIEESNSEESSKPLVPVQSSTEPDQSIEHTKEQDSAHPSSAEQIEEAIYDKELSLEHQFEDKQSLTSPDQVEVKSIDYRIKPDHSEPVHQNESVEIEAEENQTLISNDQTEEKQDDEVLSDNPAQVQEGQAPEALPIEETSRQSISALETSQSEPLPLSEFASKDPLSLQDDPADNPPSNSVSAEPVMIRSASSALPPSLTPDQTSDVKFPPPPSSLKSLFAPPPSGIDWDDVSRTELAQALEPFGYGKDKKTGEQRTTLRNLSSILTAFQRSRSTVYLSESALREIETYAAEDPDKVIGNDFVMPLLLAAKNSNDPSSSAVNLDIRPAGSEDDEERPTLRSPSGQRIRTADSPSSSDGAHGRTFFGTSSPSHSPSPTPSPLEAGHSFPVDSLAHLNRRNVARNLAIEGDDSFETSNENTIHALEAREIMDTSPTSEDTAFQPTLADLPSAGFKKPLPVSRLESAKSSPSPFSGEVRRLRPMPPNRRRKLGSGEHRRMGAMRDEAHSPENGSMAAQLRQLTCDEPDPTMEGSLGNEIDTTSYNPHLISPPRLDHSPSPPPLTVGNMSSIIFQNRHKGLYNDRHDSESEELNQPVPAHTDLMRRIRNEPRDSRVYTRVFEGGGGIDGNFDLESMREDYPKLIQECQDLRMKTKELENKMITIEKIHENEILELSEKLDELQDDLSSKKRNEKELIVNEGKYRYQLANADEEVGKLHKDLESLQENYQRIKQKYEDCISELDKLRSMLRTRDEELRYANTSLQAHSSDLRKWEEERKLVDEHVQKLQNERDMLKDAAVILEQQKQANIELQSTLDRVKHELDESRAMNQSSSMIGSRPTSIAGSVSQSFGEELKKVIASGEYDDDGDDSDTTEDGQEILTRIGDLSSNGRMDDNGHEVYEEIRIRKIKRRTLRPRSDTATPGETSEGLRQLQFEEDVVELKDAETTTFDLIPLTSTFAQTEPVPEPPPLYRPKMEDLSIQTESVPEETDDTNSKQVLQKLLANIDSSALKDMLESLEKNGGVGIASSSEHIIINDDRSSNSTPTPPSPLVTTPTLGYFQRLGLGGTSFTNSIINIRTPNTLPNPTPTKPEFNLMNANIRMYTTVIGLLATGWVLGNLFIPGYSPTQAIIFYLHKNHEGIGNHHVNHHLWSSYNSIAGGREGIMLNQGGPNGKLGVISRLTEFILKLIWEGVGITKRIPT
ncbi:hypothetical protein CROQUDRAFT_658362 [Cronartium quercuum f. sp. fusiforme G11]|uniref:Uncharacterized protein n=1 Tax=Cronartium quercuum f. sp. fusiforme G11 TaxID=708437 RepID=A0A9P6TAZ0_9BASI|nr:hypothetical protein CROQUDRAFT_658362 [Cronartium quercuum f. sp. fusiforme G11]